jgi:hypothetical protein
MKEKSFEGATQDEANQRADDWIKSQPGIRVRSRSTISTGGGSVAKPPTKISATDRWTVVVEYEDGPRLTVKTDTQAAVDKAADEADKAASTDWTADRLSRFFLLRIG